MTLRISSGPLSVRAATMAGAAALFLAPAVLAANEEYQGSAQGQPSGQQEGQQSGQYGEQGQGQMGQQTADQKEQKSGQAGAVSANLETQRGRIEKIDLNKGEIEFLPVREGQQPSAVQPSDKLTIKARPFDMERLNVGRITSVKYRNYGEKEFWLEPEQRDQRVSQLERRGWEQQRATGSVKDMDVRQGMIKVGDETFHAHPEQLKQLAPGQFVSLSFSEVGQNRWVAEIDTRAQQGSQGSQQGAPGQQQESTSP